MKKLICLVLLAMMLICVFAGCSDEPVLVKKGGSTNTTESEKETVFGVGDTVELNDVEVTLVGIHQSEGSAYNKPETGNVFVLCEFNIVNNSDEELNVSTMLNFDAYCDDYSCSLSIGALLEKEDKEQLDGTVAAGKKMNGVVGYEVPADWTEFEIRYTPDAFGGKEIVFIATND